MNKSAKIARNLLVLASAVLAGAAVLMLVNPFKTDRENELLVGGVFATVALICFISFGVNRRMYFRPGWMLQNAFFMAVFSIIIFFIPMINFDMNVLVYSFLAFFMAASQYCAAIQLSALEIRRWWWVLIFAVINTLFGVYFIKLCSVLNLSEYPSLAVYMLVLSAILLLEPWIYRKNK